MEQTTTELLVKLLVEFGLPTSLCFYLLISFEKKIDRIISLVDRLTGVILKMAELDRSDLDG
jgi:hypothetical protein